VDTILELIIFFKTKYQAEVMNCRVEGRAVNNGIHAEFKRDTPEPFTVDIL
jgi:hypothetical protein